jgi:membrane protein YqaA with SNARE-associated domain
MAELLGLFVASFAAATLIPFSSEAVLFAYLKLHPANAALAVGVATLGNTAGGMTTYFIGRLFPHRRKISEKAVARMRRFGAPATFFAWLPILGDALVLAAGWLRVSAGAVLGFMLAGRLARYVAVAVLAA